MKRTCFYLSNVCRIDLDGGGLSPQAVQPSLLLSGCNNLTPNLGEFGSRRNSVALHWWAGAYTIFFAFNVTASDP